MPFITPEEFEQRKMQDTIIPWKDVPLGKLYKIERREEITTSKGTATILTLVDVVGDSLKAFATSCLEKALAGRSHSCYIKSLGMTDSIRNPGQSYYKFELVRE